MPKLTLNLNDFSGGINTSKNARDIEINEAQDLDGLTNYEQGSLKLKGGFVRPAGFQSALGGYNDETVNLGVPNLYPVHPEYSFRIIDRADVSVSSDTATFTIKESGTEGTDGAHGLENGTKIVIFKQSSNTDYIGLQFDITVVDSTSFTATGATGLTSGIDVSYAVGVNYLTSGQISETDNAIFGNLSKLEHKQSNTFNRYLLKATQNSIFGYYNVGYNKSWYGSNKIDRNYGYKYPWLFDVRNTWDFIQTDGGSGYDVYASAPVHDIIYEKGMVKALSSFSGYLRNGLCKRPVNYMYIPKRMNFGAGAHVDKKSAYFIAPGWYNMRSHILCPEEYYDHATSAPYTSAGTLELDYDATSNPTITNPSKAHQVAVVLGTGNNAGDGDWQFATGDHRKLRLGVSFIYDNISLAFGQESPISQLGSSALTMTSCEDDKALWIYMKVFRGETTCNDTENDYLYDVGSTVPNVAVPEAKVYTGASTLYKSWNPRIVGINLYITEDYNGPLDSPLWLATFPTKWNGKAVSCDNKTGLEKWSEAAGGEDTNGICIQKIQNIQTPPTIPYNLKNGYDHEDQISAWYKTGAIVNRRLYAGNIQQFTTKPQDANKNYYAKTYPDRIIKSPLEKFDILPQNDWVDVMPQDGQSIVKLVASNNELLIFKTNDLYVLDCSGEIDVLSKTFIAKGCSNPAWIVKSSDYVFWCNNNSVYGYREGQIVDLLAKQNTDFWGKRISSSMHPVYDPSSETLFVFCKKSSNNAYDDSCIVIDITNGSVSCKSSSTEANTIFHSGGAIMDNKVYITGRVSGNGGGTDDDDHSHEEFRSQVSTSHVKGQRLIASVSFGVADSDSSAGQNILSSNASYAFIRKGSSWVQVNKAGKGFNTTVVSGNTKQKADYLIEDLNKNSFNGSLDYNLTFNYNEDSDVVTGKIISKNTGTAFNPIVATASGYSNTGFAFASAQSSGNISIANTTNFNYKIIQLGTNSVAGVFNIKPQRNGYTESGVSYRMTVYLSNKIVNGSKQYKAYTATYVTGQNAGYLLGSTSYTNDNTNDNIVSNLREFFIHNFFRGSETDDAGFKGSDLFTFGSLSGSSGNKSFDMTIINPEEYDDVIVDTEVISANGAELYVYDNEATNIITSVGDSVYITPDIDFEEPNIRKKIYKAYITYKDAGPYGRMSVYHQINQSGTWVLSTTSGTSNSGYLDENKTNFYRQEITFGTDGNNVFSIALKLENQETIKSFEINDISFVYRTKNPK